MSPRPFVAVPRTRCLQSKVVVTVRLSCRHAFVVIGCASLLLMISTLNAANAAYGAVNAANDELG